MAETREREELRGQCRNFNVTLTTQEGGEKRKEDNGDYSYEQFGKEECRCCGDSMRNYVIMIRRNPITIIIP